MPPGDLPRTVDDEPQEAAAASKEEPQEDDDFEVPSLEEMTVQAGRTPRPRATPRPIARRPRRWGPIIAWSSFVVVVAGLFGGLFFFRTTVMELWPPATQIYQVAGLVSPKTYALALANVAPAQEVEGGTPVIVITGAISNITEVAQAVPRLRGALLDADAQEIFTWTFDPPTPELGAGETEEFATRVPNPPAGARSVEVTFLDDG